MAWCWYSWCCLRQSACFAACCREPDFFFPILIFHTKSYSFLSLYSAKLSILSEIARQSTYVRPYERVQRADSLVGGSILSIGIPRGRELIGEQNSERARQILPSVRVLNYVGVLPN